MEINLPKYGLLTFEKSRDYNSSTGVTTVSDTLWEAEKTIDGLEIEFNFEVEKSDVNEVPWEQVRKVLLCMDGAIEGLVTKSVPALAALYNSIFQGKFEQLGAYFLLEEVELLVSNFGQKESLGYTTFTGPIFRLGFYLESLENQYELLDPYLGYYASFDENGTLCGVSRE